MANKKYGGRKRKPISEKPARVSYAGERSPYWDWMQYPSNAKYVDGVLVEHPLANPDMLTSSEGSIYHRPLTAIGEVMAQAVREAMPELSATERRVIELHGLDGLSLEKAAEALGITRRAVETMLGRAQDKIQRKYTWLLFLENKEK